MSELKFGRYTVLDEIGRGSSGIVYRGKDPLMDRVVAIKTIHTQSLQDEDPDKVKRFLQRFQREARASGVLSHANIVTIFDIGEENGLPYIAMEFIAGSTLSSIMTKKQLLKEGKVFKILKQVADALDYAHSQGVIHRDVKPGNVMYCDNDFIKVMDFSIARMEVPDMGTITTSGTILGTPFYMPPEQILGNKTTNKSDIYSLGVVAYELLTGSLPFPGSSIASIIYKVLHEKPIMHKKLLDLAKTANAWDDCFLKVLAKNSDDRFASASDFVDSLKKHFYIEPMEPALPKKKQQERPKFQETRILHYSHRKKNPFEDDTFDKTTLLPSDYKSASRMKGLTDSGGPGRPGPPEQKQVSQPPKVINPVPRPEPFLTTAVVLKQETSFLSKLLMAALITALLAIIYLILAQLFPVLRIIDLPFMV
ncbi:serine/threonine protein kinase [bacterium]|nr:serine/threonine protein kinase [bacterium]